MVDLAQLQAQFADHIVNDNDDPALLDSVAGRGLSPAQRLQIHQNNYALLLEDSLAATFRAVHGAVGAEFFSFMVRRFIKEQPPTQAALSSYGKHFPAFIKTVGEADGLPWLSDLAALEWARAEILNGVTDSAIIYSNHPIDHLWQGMQDPPLIDPAQIDLSDGPVVIKLHFHGDTLFFTRITGG